MIEYYSRAEGDTQPSRTLIGRCTVSVTFMIGALRSFEATTVPLYWHLPRVSRVRVTMPGLISGTHLNRDDLPVEAKPAIERLADKLKNQNFKRRSGVLICDSEDILEDVWQLMKALGYDDDEVGMPIPEYDWG